MRINFSNHWDALVSMFGDREALVNVERDRRYSFKELHELTNQIINMMINDLGLRRGDLFVNFLENDNMSLLHMPTIFKGPATAVFANFRDSLEEHTSQVELVEPKVAFIENSLIDSHFPMLREKKVTVICMDPPEKTVQGLLYFWDLVESASSQNPDVELDDREDTVLIRYTGGTTGKGKPAAYSIDNLFGMIATYYAMEDSDWGPDRKMLHVTPVSHGSGMLLLTGFCVGGCNITLNDLDFDQYCQTVAHEKATTGFLVPTILYRMLELASADKYDLSSLEYVIYGAAPMTASKLKLLQMKFGNIFSQVYGSTEHFGIAVSLSKKYHKISNVNEEPRLSSAGRPVNGVEVLLVGDDGEKVPPGEIGEIWLRSRSTIKGYYKNPEMSAAEFCNGFWKSGDMAYSDSDGFIYIVDRKKDMIISGGFNIYANEVEAAINSHDAVIMSAVVGVPHDEWGEAIHAEVILKEHVHIECDQIIAFVKEKIGKYKAPKTVVFVKDLPINPVGKLLRRTVRDKYWQRSGRKVG